MMGVSFKGLPQAVPIRIAGNDYLCQPGTFQPLLMNEGVVVRLQGLIQIWQAQNRLILAESNPESEPTMVEQCRVVLNAVYDQFVQRFGYIANNKHLIRFDGIPDPRLCILPELEVGRSLTKAPIFFERILHPQRITSGQLFFDEDLEQRLIKALNKCLDEAGGGIEIDRIAELAGTDPQTAENVLVECGRLFREPITQQGDFSRTAARRI